MNMVRPVRLSWPIRLQREEPTAISCADSGGKARHKISPLSDILAHQMRRVAVVSWLC